MKAIEATDKLIAHEQKLLRKFSRPRVEAACDAIERVADLANYNPTSVQCDAMLSALRAAIARVEKQFATITPRQTSFTLE